MTSTDVADWATAASAVVAAVALVFTGRSLSVLKRQNVVAMGTAERTSAASVSQSYGAISQGMAYINRLLLDHPTWIPYFYETADAASEDGRPPLELEPELELVCEAIMDLVDTVIEQRGTSRKASSMDWSTWDAYFRYLYNSSSVLRSYIAKNLDFYPDYEFAALGYIVVRNELTGEVASTWHSREINLQEKGDQRYAALFGLPRPAYVGVAGYPWVRTWVMEAADPDLRGDSVLVAAVEIPEPWLARVHVRSTGDVSEEAREILYRWVLGTLTTSTLIEDVHVCTSSAAEGYPSVKYDLRADPPAKAKESYGLEDFKRLG